LAPKSPPVPPFTDPTVTNVNAVMPPNRPRPSPPGVGNAPGVADPPGKPSGGAPPGPWPPFGGAPPPGNPCPATGEAAKNVSAMVSPPTVNTVPMPVSSLRRRPSGRGQMGDGDCSPVATFVLRMRDTPRNCMIESLTTRMRLFSVSIGIACEPKWRAMTVTPI
jgi:hypothetical protein